ncbi:MAG TPA: VTT domain-containing protein [Candidatus Dormibacteraeota bacterium]|nr:VTT domain-containing protein [Candidatus Dormibacteraeota bacterium]
MNQITQFLISYGGPLLFVVGFAEQSGLPFPGAPFLLAAGALAASGKFDLIAGIGWAAAGCVAADAIWFFLGHRGKSRVFRMFPHLQAVRVKLGRATLAKTVLHGARMLTAAKFLPFGTVIPMHAGALEVGRLRFLLVDAFTSVVYAAVYAALGFAFHNQLEQVVAFLRKLGAVSLLLIVVLAGTYVVHWFLKHHPKREARPDPEKRKAEGNICITSS